MSGISRRGFVAVTAAVAVTGFLPQTNLGQVASGRKRYDATTPEGKAMLKIYADGVKKMKALPDDDPRSWTFQWYTHWVPPNLDNTGKTNEIARVFGSPSPAKDLAEQMWDTCQAHGANMNEDFFLPWHRIYVLCLEDIIRGLTGQESFTLPYWDYSSSSPDRHGIIPEEFRKENDTDFGSLYVANRNKGVNDGKAIDKARPGNPLAPAALEYCQYSDLSESQPGFCSQIDFTLHGTVHVLVGNGQNMGSVPFAARDPIFWLHHCNIDRLWASWNNAGRKNPPLSGNFTFADRDGKSVIHNVKDFLEASVLPYGYDRLEDVPRCPEGGRIAMAEAIRPELVASVPTVAAKLGAAPVTVKLKPALGAGAPHGIQPLIANLPAAQRLRLIVSDLQTNEQPGVVFDVFVGLPANPSETERKQHYVGSINFFHAHTISDDAHSGHNASRAVSLDVTEIAKNIAARGMGDELDITFVPAGNPAGTARPAIGSIKLIRQ